MELKVVCECGQKYKFDVEPVRGQMPFTVNCPVCNLDGTATANLMLSQALPSPPRVAVAMAAPAPMAPPPGGLRINKAPPAPAMDLPPPLSPAPRPGGFSGPAKPPLREVKAVNEFNLGLGILGAVLGAAVGGGLMYGFFVMADFRFPLMGTGIGALTGLGARILYKGTDTTLGIISGGVALLATAGTLYLMFGDLAGMFILSMVVSVSFAYKIAG